MRDTTWCKGKVLRKYVQDGYGLADLSIEAENQRGEFTAANGKATVILPLKDTTLRIYRDGSGLGLGKPNYASNSAL